MENLVNLYVDLDGVPLETKSRVVFIMTNGSQVDIETPFTPEDFVRIWESLCRRVKILTKDKGIMCINKRRVALYHITPCS